MNFDVKCIATTHNLISKTNTLPITIGIIHVTNCKCDKRNIPTFEEAWEIKKSEGYQYNGDALENVHFGWEIRDKYGA